MISPHFSLLVCRSDESATLEERDSSPHSGLRMTNYVSVSLSRTQVISAKLERGPFKNLISKMTWLKYNNQSCLFSATIFPESDHCSWISYWGAGNSVAYQVPDPTGLKNFAMMIGSLTFVCYPTSANLSSNFLVTNFMVPPFSNSNLLQMEAACLLP